MTLEPELVTTLMVALFGGGGLVAFITAISTHTLGKSKQNVDRFATLNEGFDNLIVNFQGLVNDLSSENQRLVLRIGDLEATIGSLQVKITLLEDYIKTNNLSVPDWRKANDN